MTNQYTALTNHFDRWFKNEMQTLIDNKKYDEMHMLQINEHLAWNGYQAATKASEIEINALKERVAELEAELFVLQELRKNQATLGLELTASNNRLRDELETTLTSLQEMKDKYEIQK